MTNRNNQTQQYQHVADYSELYQLLGKDLVDGLVALGKRFHALEHEHGEEAVAKVKRPYRNVAREEYAAIMNKALDEAFGAGSK